MCCDCAVTVPGHRVVVHRRAEGAGIPSSPRHCPTFRIVFVYSNDCRKFRRTSMLVGCWYRFAVSMLRTSVGANSISTPIASILTPIAGNPWVFLVSCDRCRRPRRPTRRARSPRSPNRCGPGSARYGNGSFDIVLDHFSRMSLPALYSTPPHTRRACMHPPPTLTRRVVCSPKCPCFS